MGGVATLLVLLLLATPFLESGGATTAGGLLDRGEIIVDYLPNGTVMVYASSYDNVRFSSISVGINLSAGPMPMTPPVILDWNVWVNATDRLYLAVPIVNVTDLAVNVTTVYEGGTPIVYTVSYGVYGMVIDTSSSPGTLTAYPLSSLPSSHSQSFSLSSLPQALALSEYSYSTEPT